jgi:hypothetical protein
VYSHNPYYPGVSHTAPAEMPRLEDALQPLTRTPLHDPYFDERVLDIDDDPYEFWGW